MIPTVTYVSWAPIGAPFVVKARLRLMLQGVDFAPHRFEWNGVVAESFTGAASAVQQYAFESPASHGHVNDPG